MGCGTCIERTHSAESVSQVVQLGTHNEIHSETKAENQLADDASASDAEVEEIVHRKLSRKKDTIEGLAPIPLPIAQEAPQGPSLPPLESLLPAVCLDDFLYYSSAHFLTEINEL